MPLLDAAEARRISAQLAILEEQRAQGHLPCGDAPLRLYRVRTGGFVRVLDRHPEPISQGMLEAIDAFISSNVGSEETKEAKRNPEEAKEAQRLNVGMGVVKQTRQGQIVEVAVADTAGQYGVTASSSQVDENEDDVEKTQPSSVSSVDGVAPPWEAAVAIKSPEELLSKSERVSDYLGKQAAVRDQIETLLVQGSADNGKHLVAEVEREVMEAADYSLLFEQWPPQLEERRKLWYVARHSRRRKSDIRAKNQPVVYWMHNTLRVTQGNYGLEAAIMLSRRLAASLVVVCLVPSAIVYPVCHATTASDAYARYSFVELYQQFKQAGVPFFGITAKEIGVSSASSNDQSLTLKPNPLYELLDAFEPHAVVADAVFDPPSRRDMAHLAHYLELNRSSCSWSFLTMDSTSCCPAYQLSMKLQSTLEQGAMFASEEQFGAEYASLVQPRNDTYVFSSLPRVTALNSAVNQRREEMLLAVLQRLQLEEVNWQVVKAGNEQSSAQMRRFSEGEGLQKLSQLLSDSASEPAIQTELRGGGVLSLLPFIRHGTLSAGYVLWRITEAITSCPAPTTPQERKSLAMRKVMRSRAVNYLGKERDYLLYLSLWSAAGERFKPSGPAKPDITLLSTSEVLEGLKISASRTSSLEDYRKLLPTWAYSAARIVESSNDQAPDTAVYDPYELECARTKDLYWNEIQKLLVEQQYLHPLLIVYWAYRVLTWSVSSQAAIATIESLISQCALGSRSSPDAVFIVWKQLFRLGSSNANSMSSSKGKEIPKPEDLRQFRLSLEDELASQPKLQLRP